MGSFIAGNGVYTRWTEDGWFKNLMSTVFVLSGVFGCRGVASFCDVVGRCWACVGDGGFLCPRALAGATIRTGLAQKLGAIDKRAAAAFVHVRVFVLRWY